MMLRAKSLETFSDLGLGIFKILFSSLMGFPGSSGKKKKKNHLPVQETYKTQVQSLGWEDPLEEGMATHSSVLENPMYRGAWLATDRRVIKSRK